MTTHTQPAGCDLDSLEALEKASTPGPWDIETVRSEGEYGTDEDGGCGFDAYAVVDSKGRPMLDSLNRDDSSIHTDTDGDVLYAWDELAKRDAQFIVAAKNAMPALIAAARAAQAPQGDTRQGDEHAVLSALRDGVPLQEPVSIRKAILAHREARVSLSGGTGPVACAMLVNIQLTPWAECPEKAEAFADGFNKAMTWYRDALLSLGAHTCTPADERAEFETWHAKKYPCDPLTGPSAALRWSGFQAARATQGAGTAPTYWNSQRKMIERAIIGLRDGWATRKDADDALAMLATHPAPVSTAAATVDSQEDITTASAGELCSYHMPDGRLCPKCGNRHGTAAATTASASEQDAQYEVIVDRRDLFDFLRAAWREGSSVGWVDTAESWHKATDYAEEVIKGWNTMRDVAPSRAADGQQGASRAALDELVTRLRNCLFKNVPPYRGDLEAACDLLARNLPAQGAAQVEVEAARDEVLEEAAKVCEAQATEYFPMTAKGLADAIRALKSDCAAQSRAQSDTTGDHNA